MTRQRRMKTVKAWALLDRRGAFYRGSSSRKAMKNLLAMVSGLGPGTGVWRIARVEIREVMK